MRLARVFAVVLALGVFAAPIALDACAISCEAAATRTAHIGAPPCHHHAGHHPMARDRSGFGMRDSGFAVLDDRASIGLDSTNPDSNPKSQIPNPGTRNSPSGADTQAPLRI